MALLDVAAQFNGSLFLYDTLNTIFLFRYLVIHNVEMEYEKVMKFAIVAVQT